MATTPPQQDYWELDEAAKKINSLFANQVYVQHLGDGLLRVNFGEVLDNDPRFHTAIVLTANNARDFGTLITRMAYAAGAAVPPPPVPPPPPVTTPPPPFGHNG